jgi:hypothetical protein
LIFALIINFILQIYCTKKIIFNLKTTKTIYFSGVYNEVLSKATTQQAIVALGGCGALKNDLGDQFDAVSGKLFGSLNSVLDEVFNAVCGL